MCAAPAHPHKKLTLRPLATAAILCCTSCSCETRALALTASTFISVSVMLVPIDTPGTVEGCKV